MKVTIDKAGRVVIPAAIREQAGFMPGTEIEIEADDTSVRLVRRVQGPQLTRVGKLLVSRPTAPAHERREVDVGALVERERDRR